MLLICPSWSTTIVLGLPSPAAHAWCYVKAASAWAQTATFWGRGITCCAQSPPSQPPAPRQATSTTDQSAHRASQTVRGWSGSGWSAHTATARERPSAAWASQRAVGAAAAALSWSRVFSAQNEIREGIFGRVTYRSCADEQTRNIKINANSEEQLTCTRWVDTTRKITGAINHSLQKKHQLPSTQIYMDRGYIYYKTLNRHFKKHVPEAGTQTDKVITVGNQTVSTV